MCGVSSLFIALFLLHFVFIETKICPKCEIPSFLRTEHPMYVAPSTPLDISKCLYPTDIHPKLDDLTRISTPVCVHIIPLRDDFLSFYFPDQNDTYFVKFWEENGARCLKYFGSEVLGFYNFAKYDNLPTDIIYSCSSGLNVSNIESREDALDNYLSQLFLQFMQEMEGKPNHRVMRCYDRDTDLSNSHWTLYNCMFAVMNRTFSVGPLSFNAFFVDHVDNASANFAPLQNTFLSAQARQEGCAIAQKGDDGSIEILRDVSSSNYLDEGECTGTLNLFGFDLLCCCYENVLGCLYTASPYTTEFDKDKKYLANLDLKDDRFMCILGSLNSTSPELKFRGSRKNILTDLAPVCYTLLTITYDKDLVFNLSITFGADFTSNQICNETDGKNDTTSNSWQYLKSPWGFRSVYNVQEEPIQIVRCCKGNFCNHFGMFDQKSEYAWPRKFQYKMNKDWVMKCGYLPVDILWTIFEPKNKTRECMRSISEDKTAVIQPFLGGRDYVNSPLYRAVKRENANFTGILPAEPLFCFYAGIPSSEAFNRSGMPEKYIRKMVFGCQINNSFTIDFTPSPDFNTHIHIYQQNILRQLRNQYLPYPKCLSTYGTSVELLSFLRVNEKEKLIWYPICFAMVYRDFHQTFFRAGACSEDETCCDWKLWTDKYFDLEANHIYNQTTKRYEGKPYENAFEAIYSCNSQWCMSDQMDARCLHYAGKEYTPAEIISKLDNSDFTNDVFPSRAYQTEVSLTVSSMKGYDPSNFKPLVRERYITSVETQCTTNDSCFETNSVFYTSHVSSAFPFCIWSPQRQYGADYSREIVIADASNAPNRTRFELNCKFDSSKALMPPPTSPADPEKGNEVPTNKAAPITINGRKIVVKNDDLKFFKKDL